jgi:hypothetical protein
MRGLANGDANVENVASDNAGPALSRESQASFVRMFNYELCGDEYKFTCSLPCTSHKARTTIAALQTSGCRQIPKPSLKSHIKSKHNISWSVENWRALHRQDDDAQTKTFQNAAVRW